MQTDINLLPITNFVLEELDYKYHYNLATPAHGGKSVAKSFWTKFGIENIEAIDVPYVSKKTITESEAYSTSLYGTKQTFYFTTGVSHAILVGLYSTINRQDEVIIGRNIHVSVFSALSIIEAKIKWLIPENKYFKYSLDLIKKSITKATKAVILTNPSYDGYIIEIKEIAKFCKENNILLIIDESLGAHWLFSKLLPESAINQNADMVFHSLHKRLGALVPSALLHIPKNSRIAIESIRRTKMLFTSTSPSNIILMSIESTIINCFERESNECDELVNKCRDLKTKLVADRILSTNPDVINSDPFTINIKHLGSVDKDIELELFEKYHINYELITNSEIILFISFLTDKSKINNIQEAIVKFVDDCLTIDNTKTYNSIYSSIPQIRYDAKQLQKYHSNKVLLSNSNLGNIANELYALCPPGIPILFPGEEINESHINILKNEKIEIILSE